MEHRLTTPAVLSGHRRRALFDLRERQVHNNSKVSGSGPVSVLTPAAQWSYAVGFPVRENARGMIPPLAEIVVRMEAVVEIGTIGIGVVSSDLSIYLTPEKEFSASGDAVDCEFVLSGLRSDSVLMVRNAAGNQVVSKAVIRSLETFLVRRD